MSDIGTQIDLQDYEERKFAELRPLMLFATIFGGFFSLCLWIWDYAVDSVHAPETIGWRVLMAFAVWVFGVGYLQLRLPRKWYFLSLTAGIWIVLFAFGKITEILIQGGAYGTGGYIFGEFIPLIGLLGVPRKQAIAALTLIAASPYVFLVAGLMKNSPIGVISAYLLPTFGMSAAFAFFIDLLFRRIYSSRKQVEVEKERVLEEQERFQMLTEVAEEGIALSLNGIVLDSNEQYAKLLGYERAEEVKGIRVIDIIAPEMKDYVLNLVQKNWDKPYEAVFVRKDGSRRMYEAFGKQITYKGQKVRISSVRDITERKRAESELKYAKETAEQATKLKDKFVSLVAHDLKSPLGVIIGLLQMLKEDADGVLSDKKREMIEHVLTSGRNLHRMIEELLTISSLQTGKIELQKNFINLYSLVFEIVFEYDGSSREKEIKIELNIPAHFVIYADQNLLREVMRNLVSNAVKFTPRGGKVEIFSRLTKPPLSPCETPGWESRRIEYK
jgi:PAS domain S-box-containing protein